MTWSSPAQGPDHLEIRADDGTTYTFTGTNAAAVEWSRTVSGQLRDRYGLDEQERLGGRLGWAGVVLAGLGFVLGGCGAVRRVRARSRG
jgi:hypothetical protein